MKEEHLRLRDHDPEELAFYSKATTDFEYLFPFGWGELWGVADRTDYDLKQHQEHSGENMEYLDPVTNERFIPLLHRAFAGRGPRRAGLPVRRLRRGRARRRRHARGAAPAPGLAPFKAAVLPLQKNKLGDKAREVYGMLAKRFMVDYDETGSIGKRYRRQDEAGTPLCITVDFDTLETGKVTVRDRDTMQQELVAIEGLAAYIDQKIDF